MGDPSTAKKLKSIYDRLFSCYGPQRWWPAETPFEVMVGGVLTQSAAWSKVEKAITNLKSANMMSSAALRQIPIAELASLIYPSGYYNAKAKKLKALVEWLRRYDDDLSKLDSRDTSELREELLAVHGIGPETADSILLYALDRATFVIDAYTRRLFSRLGIKPDNDTYGGWRALFTDSLPPDVKMFNEYHALIIRHGKENCRKSARCVECCLGDECSESAVHPSTGSGRTD